MTQDNRIMFFLGAGASYGAGACATVQAGGSLPIPTQADFWVTFLRFCKSRNNRNLIESFLFRYFLGYKRKPAKITALNRNSLLKTVDVEEVFTFLSERVRAPSTTVQLRSYAKRVWIALTEEIGHVFNRFEANSSTKKLYRTFYKKHIHRSDAIVSFNYDTIFEDSLPSVARWSYIGVEDAPKGIRIYKPHGSINWENIDNSIKVVKIPNKCVVVVPTHLKFISGHENGDQAGYLDQTGEISKIWSEMEKEMKRASALVFIGYSFPVADLYFASIIRSVLADRDAAPTVVIVNPDAVAIANRIMRRFHLSTVVKYFDLNQFVAARREDLY